MIKNFYSTIVICLTLSIATNLHGQEISLDLFIKNQADKYHIPGIAACVIKDTKIVWSEAYGYSNIEREEAMSNESILNIASISKTITATAIMQLWEQEQLKLEEDVNLYLDFDVRNPNYPDIPITIKQLLTHTSSIADGSAIKIGYECGDPQKSLKDWLTNYFVPEGAFYNEKENFHNNKPDSLRAYSNIGFGLLGLVVEEVSKKTFNEYVHKYIFEPLHMNDSGYYLSEIDRSKLATTYLYLGPLQRNLSNTENNILPYYNPYCYYSFWNYPDGLVRTSTNDLAKFAIAYMNGGVYKDARILKQQTIDLMMSPMLSEKVNEDKDQGLCWFQSPSLYPTWYHGGSDPGVSTRLYINTKDKISVIVFQNANADNSFYIVNELYNRFK
ncbi:MAG: serine hydrolase domain-containing protein [Bacteroidota bacterium]